MKLFERADPAKIVIAFTSIKLVLKDLQKMLLIPAIGDRLSLFFLLKVIHLPMGRHSKQSLVYVRYFCYKFCLFPTVHF